MARVLVALLLVAAPTIATAEPVTVQMPDGRTVTLLGVDALATPGCEGQAARALTMHRPAKVEADPASANGFYVFDLNGRLMNAVALEWGCATNNAPRAAKRYEELESAIRTAQSMNRGRYGAQPVNTPAPSEPAPLSSTGSLPAYDAIGLWTGAGTKETESFTTTGREWRIRWAATPDNARIGGTLSILVYNSDGDLVSTITSGDITGTRGDTSFVRGAPGRYYLKILSANCAWRVAAIP